MVFVFCLGRGLDHGHDVLGCGLGLGLDCDLGVVIVLVCSWSLSRFKNGAHLSNLWYD